MFRQYWAVLVPGGRSCVNGTEWTVCMMIRGWLELPGAAQRQAIATATNPYFGHLPETSWRMLASGV